MSKKKVTVTNNLTPENIHKFIEKLGREISDLANKRVELEELDIKIKSTHQG